MMCVGDYRTGKGMLFAERKMLCSTTGGEGEERRRVIIEQDATKYDYLGERRINCFSNCMGH